MINRYERFDIENNKLSYLEKVLLLEKNVIILNLIFYQEKDV